MGFWSKLFGLDNYIEVPRQDNSLDVADLKAELMATDKDYRRMMKSLECQDKQLEKINKAEADYKDDPEKLVEFWEKLLSTDGLLFNSSKWSFRIVELYYKTKRYDDAWRELNKLVLNPAYQRKARQWQIRILKKEKKDYSHIQDLLDKNL